MIRDLTEKATKNSAVSFGSTMQPKKRHNIRRVLWNETIIRLGFLVFLVLLWQALHHVVVTKTEWWSGALFPAPLEVGQWLWRGFGLDYLTGGYRPAPGAAMPNQFWQALQHAEYPGAIAASIWRLLQGYAISLLLGLPLGLLVARFKLADQTIGWLSTSLQALPSICWIPLALLWFGRGGVNGPILFVTIFGSLFSTIVTVADGIRTVSPSINRAGRTLGANGFALYWRVLLPAALPSILSGLKVGWGFAWRSLMAAELIVASGGLGFLLERDRDFGDTSGVLSTILVIVLIGVVIQALVFGPLQQRVHRLWGLNLSR